MFILFGVKEKRRDHGSTISIVCPNCGNRTNLRLVEIEKWFAVFFIPILPYDSIYRVQCEICSRGMELSDEDFERAKRICRAARAFRKQRISEEEYQRIVERSRLFTDMSRYSVKALENKRTTSD